MQVLLKQFLLANFRSIKCRYIYLKTII